MSFGPMRDRLVPAFVLVQLVLVGRLSVILGENLGSGDGRGINYDSVFIHPERVVLCVRSRRAVLLGVFFELHNLNNLNYFNDFRNSQISPRRAMLSCFHMMALLWACLIYNTVSYILAIF